jgi:hypothetical protein
MYLEISLSVPGSFIYLVGKIGEISKSVFANFLNLHDRPVPILAPRLGAVTGIAIFILDLFLALFLLQSLVNDCKKQSGRHREQVL